MKKWFEKNATTIMLCIVFLAIGWGAGIFYEKHVNNPFKRSKWYAMGWDDAAVFLENGCRPLDSHGQIKISSKGRFRSKYPKTWCRTVMEEQDGTMYLLMSPVEPGVSQHLTFYWSEMKP